MLSLFSSINNASDKKPRCTLYADTHGEWVSISDRRVTNYSLFSSIFSGDVPKDGSMMAFNKVWIPNNCSYHRFTNNTINFCVNRKISLYHKSMSNHKIFSIAIFGDSGIRGILCGITRLIAGSEIYGPNENAICGGKGFGDPVSVKSQLIYNDIKFYGGKLLITFTYVKDFLRNLEKSIMTLIRENYNIIILNTGTWDFYKVPRYYYSNSRNITEHCATNESMEVSKGRSLLGLMIQCGELAISHIIEIYDLFIETIIIIKDMVHYVLMKILKI